jgi:hypothetical protein
MSGLRGKWNPSGSSLFCKKNLRSYFILTKSSSITHIKKTSDRPQRAHPRSGTGPTDMRDMVSLLSRSALAAAGVPGQVGREEDEEDCRWPRTKRICVWVKYKILGFFAKWNR